MPTFLSAKLALAPPPSVTTSLPKMPENAAPAIVAAVVASYTLFCAVSPLSVRLAGVMTPMFPLALVGSV